MIILHYTVWGRLYHVKTAAKAHLIHLLCSAIWTSSMNKAPKELPPTEYWILLKPLCKPTKWLNAKIPICSRKYPWMFHLGLKNLKCSFILMLGQMYLSWTCMSRTHDNVHRLDELWLVYLINWPASLFTHLLHILLHMNGRRCMYPDSSG